jgi:hypothetical protein
MIPPLAAILLYLAPAVLARAAAGYLGRPVERRVFALLLLLPLLFVSPALVGNRTLLPVDHALMLPPWNSLPHAPARNGNLNDAITQMAPWAKAVRSAYKEHSFPWLDRWNGCGTPLFANGQSAPFSPFTLLMLPLPLAAAFNLLAAVKLFVALLGMWLWLTELGVSKVSSLLGSVAFAFSFAMTPWLLFPHTAVIAFWPWLLFLAERLDPEKSGRRAFIALTALLAVWPLLGHIESAVLGATFAALWLSLHALGRRRAPAARRRLAGFLGAGLLAAGISAFSTLPQYVAILASNRASIAEHPLWESYFSWLPHAPAWRLGFVTMFFPRTLGDAIASPMIDGRAGSFPEMGLAYFGLIGWTAAILFVRPGSRRKRTEWILLALLLAGCGVATGCWPLAELAGFSPALRLMLPLRFFSWVSLAGPALAALELDRLSLDFDQNRRSAPIFLAGAFALTALFALAVFLHFRPAHAAAGSSVSQTRALEEGLAILAAGFLLALAASAGRIRAPLLLGGLLVLSGGELFFQGLRLYRFGSPAALFPDTPIVTFLKTRPGTFRVTGEGAALFPNSNVFAGLEEVRTHDPIERRDYVTFLDRACGYPPAEYFKFFGNLNAPELDFLNVRYLVSAAGRAAPGEKWRQIYSGIDGTVFENSKSAPRIFLLAPAKGSITELVETTNSVAFRCDVTGSEAVNAAASLVDDGGWRALDETGHRVALERFHTTFLSLRLPPGKHRVRLRYFPPGLRAGLAVSVSTLALIAAARVARARSRARRREASARRAAGGA